MTTAKDPNVDTSFDPTEPTKADIKEAKAQIAAEDATAAGATSKGSPVVNKDTKPGKTTRATPDTQYEVPFLVMVSDPGKSFHDPISKLKVHGVQIAEVLELTPLTRMWLQSGGLKVVDEAGETVSIGRPKRGVGVSTQVFGKQSPAPLEPHPGTPPEVELPDPYRALSPAQARAKASAAASVGPTTKVEIVDRAKVVRDKEKELGLDDLLGDDEAEEEPVEGEAPKPTGKKNS
jgi:hypothetical protein